MMQSTINLDPTGDLTVLVDIDHEKTRLIVSSQALCLASPVWRAMLNPESGFQEATSADRTISFPDDDAQTLLLLFRICHLRFSEVPQTLDLNQLFETAVLCDKYDIVTLIRPWLSKWQQPLLPRAGEDDDEKWLFISWTLGDSGIFERIVKKLVLTSESREEGQCLSSNGKLLESSIPEVIESILAARQTALNRLLRLCYDSVDLFQNSNCFLHATKHQIECNSLVIGSRILELKKAELWPKRVTPSEITVSVQQFALQLLEFNFLSKEHSQKSYSCHKTEEFHGCVRSVLSNMPRGMLECHRTHLKAQAEK